MKILNLIFIVVILSACGTSQNSGLEIFEAFPKEEQKRILEQIQPPLTYNYLKLLPFDGKSNFQDIDFLSRNIKSIKTIHRNYRIKKENWTVDNLAKPENQGQIVELFFDPNQKIIKAMEYTAEHGVAEEDIL